MKRKWQRSDFVILKKFVNGDHQLISKILSNKEKMMSMLDEECIISDALSAGLIKQLDNPMHPASLNKRYITVHVWTLKGYLFRLLKAF